MYLTSSFLTLFVLNRERMAVARPTSLNVEAKLGKLARPGSGSGQTLTETLPTPMEEPRKAGVNIWQKVRNKKGVLTRK